MINVSVVIPYYNDGEKVRKSVESILEDNRASDINYEILIGDDGSEIPPPIEENSRIRILKFDHMGHPSRVRNEIVKKASFPILMFIDAHDYFIRDSIPEVLRFFKENNLQALLVNGYMVNYRTNKIIREFYPILKKYAFKKVEFEDLALTFSNLISAYMGTLIISKSLYEELGGLDEQIRYREDWEFLTRLAYTGNLYYFNKFICKAFVAMDKGFSKYHKERYEFDQLHLPAMKRLLEKIQLSPIRKARIYREFYTQFAHYFARKKKRMKALYYLYKSIKVGGFIDLRTYKAIVRLVI